MYYFSRSLPKLLTVAAVAITFGGCQRAEYALLPKTSSYHVAYQAPTQPAPEVKPLSEAAVNLQTPPVAPTASAQLASAAPQVVAKPVAPSAAAAPAATSRRPGLLQKMLANKAVKKVDKLAAKLLKQPQNTAEVNRISGYLRTGLLLILIGLLITVIPGGSFNTIGTVVAIIGVVFLALWLLDEL